MCLTTDIQHTLCYHTTHSTEFCFQARHPVLTSALRILSFSPDTPRCPRKRKTEYHWTCCPACTATFHDAGIPTHTYSMMVHNWRVENDYHGPLAVVRGVVGVTLFKEDDVWGLGRVARAAGVNVTPGAGGLGASARRDEQAGRQGQAGRLGQAGRQEGDVFVDIELDERWAEEQRKEREYADMVRAWGRADEEAEREEIARKALQRIADRAAKREERRQLEAGEIPERKMAAHMAAQMTPQRTRDVSPDVSPQTTPRMAPRTRTV